MRPLLLADVEVCATLPCRAQNNASVQVAEVPLLQKVIYISRELMQDVCVAMNNRMAVAGRRAKHISSAVTNYALNNKT